VPSIWENLVVLENHLRNLRGPFVLPGANQVSARQLHGRFQIIEGMVGPDTQVMKRRSRGELFQLRELSRKERDAKVDDAIGVVPVSREINAEFNSVFLEYLVKNRNLCKQDLTLPPSMASSIFRRTSICAPYPVVCLDNGPSFAQDRCPAESLLQRAAAIWLGLRGT
jgi:hypothetical protein